MTDTTLDALLEAVRNLPELDLVKLRNAIELELTRRDICEHGVQCGEWCPQCKAEYAAAIAENG